MTEQKNHRTLVEVVSRLLTSGLTRGQTIGLQAGLHAGLHALADLQAAPRKKDMPYLGYPFTKTLWKRTLR